MPLISLAMIVKNEEATLGHCLESVRPIVDEMVVVDTGSTDKTIEIARSFGARVYHFDWCDDFAAARNESLKYCTGEWILILDADEAIDPLDYDKIRGACLKPFADAYNLKSRSYLLNSDSTLLGGETLPNESPYYEGKDYPFYSDIPVLRLSKKFDGLAFSGRVHEMIHKSMSDYGKAVGTLDAVLHHYGKLSRDIEKHKAQYYFMLAMKGAENNPADYQTQFSLMQQAIAAGSWEVALDAAQWVINNHPDAVEHTTLYSKGRALRELGRHEEAISAFDLLLDLEPEHVWSLKYKGFSHIEMGNASAGRQCILKAAELEGDLTRAYLYLASKDLEANDFDAARRTAWEGIEAAPDELDFYGLLVKIELAANNPKKAVEVAMLGLRRCSQNIQSSQSSQKNKDKLRRYVALYCRQVAEIEMGQNNMDGARKIALEALEVVPGEAGFYDILLRVEMAGGNHGQAARYAIQGIQNCPSGGDGLWHRLAFVFLLQSGEKETARSILELGIETFPDDAELKRLKGFRT
ncbi:MAG: glycosyltransferase [Holophagaceae bacterium]|nr:glycosyltransferase [Holophagaceae bacterium]